MIIAALLLASQLSDGSISVDAAKEALVTTCAANQRISALFDGKSVKSDQGYRLVYALMGDQRSLADLGSKFEKQHSDVRWTVLPVLKDTFLFTLEIARFRGDQSYLSAVTLEVCREAVDANVNLLGWQLIDRNLTVAGASDQVEDYAQTH